MKSIKVVQIENIESDPTVVEYAVNENGNGLWINGKQRMGTCDFHASTPAEFSRKLRRQYDFFESIKMVRGSAQGW